jgi:two-component system phosphate regulon response regulator OmpR
MNEDALVLVVDDDVRLRTLLSRFLSENGFRVTTADHARDARDKMRIFQPDLMVLDVMMPGETGLSLVESLRAERSDLPVLLLTARGAPEDRIRGFESGADDYLPKPFEPRELLLRLRALMRRTAPAAALPARGPVQLGDMTFDPDRGELRGPEGVMHLTGGEAGLLAALARRPNEPLSREELAELLGTGEAGERAIDVHVTRLRRKIEADPREPRFLQTVRGRGYVVRPGP